MTIEIKKNAAETIIRIVGRLDTITAPALDKAINEDIGDTRNLILDMKSLEYISSAGLRVLLIMQNDCEDGVIMKSCNESVIRALSNTHIEIFNKTAD